MTQARVTQDGVKPECSCHGEPMYWNQDGRSRAGGYWRCAVKAREKERRMYAKHREARRAQQKAYWQRPHGGWLSLRRRQLAASRRRIMERLDQLAEERETDAKP